MFNSNIEIPNAISLKGAYPNPFNPVTSIKFSVPQQMHVEINILDIQGRLVSQVTKGIYEYGNNEVMFSGNLLASGIYFIQLVTEKDVQYSKMVLLK